MQSKKGVFGFFYIKKGKKSKFKEFFKRIILLYAREK